ncbi:MAG: hypothetical protein ACREV0_11955 [Burkholderiales bacterium]
MGDCKLGLALLAVALASCSANYPNRPPSDFRLRDVAKTDIDRVTEIHLQETLLHLKTLMEKLYRRNPLEWKKNGDEAAEKVIARVFDRRDFAFKGLEGRRGADAIVLAFKEDYSGDRVAAYIVGLTTMILSAYGDKTEFFMLDDVDPQKLYNSARNVEIAVWRLSNARNSKNELYLLSNEPEGPVRNLSFEREFGKIIAELDTMARVISTQNNRSVVRVIQNVATAVFLPI